MCASSRSVASWIPPQKKFSTWYLTLRRAELKVGSVRVSHMPLSRAPPGSGIKRTPVWLKIGYSNNADFSLCHLSQTRVPAVQPWSCLSSKYSFSCYCKGSLLMNSFPHTSGPLLVCSQGNGHCRSNSTNGELGGERRVARWRLPQVGSF